MTAVNFFQPSPQMMIIPGIAICLSVLFFNYIGSVYPKNSMFAIRLVSELNVLDLKNLSIVYGNKTLVDNVSFSIEQGEMMALIGESGSGKKHYCLCCRADFTGNTEGKVRKCYS